MYEDDVNERVPELSWLYILSEQTNVEFTWICCGSKFINFRSLIKFQTFQDYLKFLNESTSRNLNLITKSSISLKNI